MSRYVVILLVTVMTSSCLSVRISLNVPPKQFILDQDTLIAESQPSVNEKTISPAKTALLGGVMFGGLTLLVAVSTDGVSSVDILKGSYFIGGIAAIGAGLGYVLGKEHQKSLNKKKREAAKDDNSKTLMLRFPR